MKKVKIMLTAIVIMAAAGGALAFKANKVNNKTYCTTTNIIAAMCPNIVVNVTFTAMQGQVVRYVLLAPGENCTNKICTDQGVMVVQL